MEVAVDLQKGDFANGRNLNELRPKPDALHPEGVSDDLRGRRKSALKKRLGCKTLCLKRSVGLQNPKP